MNKYYCGVCNKTLNENEVEIKKLDIKLAPVHQEEFGQKTVCKTCEKEVSESRDICPPKKTE